MLSLSLSLSRSVQIHAALCFSFWSIWYCFFVYKIKNAQNICKKKKHSFWQLRRVKMNPVFVELLFEQIFALFTQQRQGKRVQIWKNLRIIFIFTRYITYCILSSTYICSMVLIEKKFHGQKFVQNAICAMHRPLSKRTELHKYARKLFEWNNCYQACVLIMVWLDAKFLFYIHIHTFVWLDFVIE